MNKYLINLKARVGPYKGTYRIIDSMSPDEATHSYIERERCLFEDMNLINGHTKQTEDIHVVIIASIENGILKVFDESVSYCHIKELQFSLKLFVLQPNGFDNVYHVMSDCKENAYKSFLIYMQSHNKYAYGKFENMSIEKLPGFYSLDEYELGHVTMFDLS